MKNFLLVLLFTMFSPSAMAQGLCIGCSFGQWTTVTYDVMGPGDRVTIYADLSTIRKIGSKVTMLTMGSYTKIQEAAGKKYLSDNTISEFDCQNITTTMLSFSGLTERLGKGKVVFTDRTRGKTERVFTGTKDGLIWEAACSDNIQARKPPSTIDESAFQDRLVFPGGVTSPTSTRIVSEIPKEFQGNWLPDCRKETVMNFTDEYLGGSFRFHKSGWSNWSENSTIKSGRWSESKMSLDASMTSCSEGECSKEPHQESWVLSKDGKIITRLFAKAAENIKYYKLDVDGSDTWCGNSKITLPKPVLKVVSNSIHTASFDCLKSKSSKEKAICSDSELSKLDKDLAQAYKIAIKLHPVANFVKLRQRDWLESNSYCRFNDELIGCLKENYKKRIAQLSNIENLIVYSDTNKSSFEIGHTVAEIRKEGSKNSIIVWGGFRMHRAASEGNGEPVYTGCSFEGTFISPNGGKAVDGLGESTFDFNISNRVLTIIESDNCEGFGMFADYLNLVERK